MKPFIYAHELIENTAGIWIGCNDEASVHGSYTEGETGKEVVALYHEKDFKEVVDLVKLMKENHGLLTHEQWDRVNSILEGFK